MCLQITLKAPKPQLYSGPSRIKLGAACNDEQLVAALLVQKSLSSDESILDTRSKRLF